MIVITSGSRGAAVSAVRMSWIAASGRSAAIAARARSFSAATCVWSSASTVLEQRGARLGLAGGGQHLGEPDLEVAGLVRGGGAVEEPLHGGDRRVGVPLREVEPGERLGVGPRVGGGRRPRRQLGPGGVGAADLEQELRERQRGAGIAADRRRRRAAPPRPGRGRRSSGATGPAPRACRHCPGRAGSWWRARRRWRPCRRAPRAAPGARGAGRRRPAPPRGRRRPGRARRRDPAPPAGRRPPPCAP